MQRLYLSVESGADGFGLEHWVLRLRGPLDREALRAAWAATVARHPMLRTAFVTEGVAEPLQVVLRDVPLLWSELDWGNGDASEPESALAGLLGSEHERCFDVRVAPLSRVTLVRLGEDEHRLVWTTHHLYVDGWSWPLILRDVGAEYRARLDGTSTQQPRPTPFGTYIGWLATAAPDSRAFWKDQLEGFTSPTPLPVAPRASSEKRGDEEVRVTLDAERSRALQELARELRMTTSTVVQGAWALVLRHLSGRDDVVFGAAFSGRPPELPGVEMLVGPCVNNLPVRVLVRPGSRASDWLGALHRSTVEIAQHQYASLADVQAWAAVPWRLRLFDSLVVFQNYQVEADVLDWGRLRLEPELAPDETAYPLTLTVTPRDEIELKLSSSGGRIPHETLAAMAEHMSTLLGGLVERPAATVAELAALLPAATSGIATEREPVTESDPGPYVPPSNEMERKVAAIWADLFQVERVGLDENFFDLGGHSILLVQAHARLRSTVRTDLPVVALLQYPTVRALAAYLANGESSRGTVGAARDRATLQRQALARQRRIRETT
jgi:acyl carrier protein